MNQSQLGLWLIRLFLFFQIYISQTYLLCVFNQFVCCVCNIWHCRFRKQLIQIKKNLNIVLHKTKKAAIPRRIPHFSKQIPDQDLMTIQTLWTPEKLITMRHCYYYLTENIIILANYFRVMQIEGSGILWENVIHHGWKQFQ